MDGFSSKVDKAKVGWSGLEVRSEEIIQNVAWTEEKAKIRAERVRDLKDRVRISN